MKLKDLRVSEEIKNEIKIAYKLANNTVRSGEQVLPKVLLGNTKSGHKSIIGAVFEDEEEKDLFAQFIKEKAAEIKADLSIFTAESFALQGEDAEDYQANLEKYEYSMGNHPKAKEIVVFMVETSESCYHGQSLIMTDENNNRYLGELQITAMRDLEGRFGKLLPKR